jgi:hypothetical protein
MKQISITLIFALISIISLFGQNYQTIYSNRIAFFDNQYGNIKSIRIDSVIIQNDKVLYPFTQIQQLDYDCFSPLIASWIGKKVIVKESGNNCFFNKHNDTIMIKTSARINDKWVAFQIKDSLTIEASVIAHDKMNFLGLADSVKVIGFQAYDENMASLDFAINEMNIQISKNYGLIKTFNFYLFPNFKVAYSAEQFEEYDLIGLSSPKFGVQNLTWFEVNDFQVGDELHVLDESSCWRVNDYGYDYGYAITNKAIYKYLQRTDYLDSIVYRYSRKQSIYTHWKDSSSFKYNSDTLTSIIKPDSLFDKLPGEPIVNEYGTFSFCMTNEFLLSKTYPSVYEMYSFTGDSCWRTLIADGCFPADKYIKGLGGPYYSCSEAFCLGGAERKLVYYKKGENTWGNPLIVTGISDMETINKIKVYPKPADDYVYVSLGENKCYNCFIYIYDIHGKLQKAKRLEANNSGIDISDLKNGIYIVKISDNGRVLKMDKLVIE